MEHTNFLDKLAVVIVAFNSDAVLPEMLSALNTHLPGAEVLIVNNGPTTASFADHVYDDITPRVVQGHGNIGFGAGMNLGAREAHREFLVMLNPDAPPIAVDRSLFSELAEEQFVGLLACRIQSREDHAYHALFRQWGWRREIAWAFGSALLKPRGVKLARPRVRHASCAQWAGGAALIAKRDEFLELGGFDANLFLYCEDRDLSRRYLECGLGLRPTNALTVMHRGGGSSPSEPIMQIVCGQLARLQYIAKWETPEIAMQAVRYTLFLNSSVAMLSRYMVGVVPGSLRLKKWARICRAVQEEMLDAGASPRIASGYYEDARRALLGSRNRDSSASGRS